MQQRLALFAAALWWGSLTAVGFLVVPLLFAHLPTPALAGQTAARLFSAQTWVSVVCGLLLLVLARPERARDAAVPVAAGPLMLAMGGMLLALLAEFAVAPRIVARDNLRLWHAVGTGLYLAQWSCAAALLWRQPGRGGGSTLLD